MRKIYDVLNVVFLALTTYTVLSAYPRLPDRIPVHFNIAGDPDRWGGKSEILILVAVVWGLNILLYVFTLTMPSLARHPQRLNIPHKQEFLKLPAATQAVYWALLREFMTGLTVAINLIFYLLVHATLEVVLGKATSFVVRDMWAGFLVLALMLIFYLPRLFTLPGKLVRGEEF
jgi:uncharacterized membrane protein